MQNVVTWLHAKTCYSTPVKELDILMYSTPSRQVKVGKGKRAFVSRLVVNTPLRRSGMARVLKGSHGFTCTPRVHPLTE